MKRLLYFIVVPVLLQCASTEEPKDDETIEGFANVKDVAATQSGDNFTFQVTIKSPDTGCEQYADWWEVVSEEEELIYRRILLHSHVDEQPFLRSGGPVRISENTQVWIRAHMNNSGYGGEAFYGSINDGFEVKVMPEDFALELEDSQPLPDDCAF